MLLRTGKKNYHQIGISMETDIAFPYKPPLEDTKKKYIYIFDLQNYQKLVFINLLLKNYLL